jgi:hypothetical protein
MADDVSLVAAPHPTQVPAVILARPSQSLTGLQTVGVVPDDGSARLNVTPTAAITTPGGIVTPREELDRFPDVINVVALAAEVALQRRRHWIWRAAPRRSLAAQRLRPVVAA